jgi:hypothetical protein
VRVPLSLPSATAMAGSAVGAARSLVAQAGFVAMAGSAASTARSLVALLAGQAVTAFWLAAVARGMAHARRRHGGPWWLAAARGAGSVHGLASGDGSWRARPRICGGGRGGATRWWGPPASGPWAPLAVSSRCLVAGVEEGASWSWSSVSAQPDLGREVACRQWCRRI